MKKLNMFCALFTYFNGLPCLSKKPPHQESKYFGKYSYPSSYNNLFESFNVISFF